MRTIVTLGMAVMAAALASCQITGAYHDAGYRSSGDVYTADIPPRPVYPQYVLTFPDETMYFGSCIERSGLITCQLCPALFVLKMTLHP